MKKKSNFNAFGISKNNALSKIPASQHRALDQWIRLGHKPTFEYPGDVMQRRLHGGQKG